MRLIKYLFYRIKTYLKILPSNIVAPLYKKVIERKYRNFIYELNDLSTKFPVKKSYFDKHAVKNILVIRLDLIGDLVMTTPLLKTLRENFPSANIDIIVRPQVKALLENCPYINNKYYYNTENLNIKYNPNKAGYFRNKAQKFMNQLFEKQEYLYDVCILPREQFLGTDYESLYLAAFSKAGFRVGRAYATDIFFQTSSELYNSFFSHLYLMRNPIHEVSQMQAMLEELGLEAPDFDTELWLSNEDSFYLNEWKKKYSVHGTDKLIFLGVEGSTPNKNWRYQNYIEIIKRYSRSNIKFIVLGTKDDIYKRIDSDNVINMSGQTTLRQAIVLLSSADLYLGSDTGIAHVAAAFGKACIILSEHLMNGDAMDGNGPTLFRPWNVKSVILEPKDGLDYCVGHCQENYSHCINQISIDHVSDVINKMITALKW